LENLGETWRCKDFTSFFLYFCAFLVGKSINLKNVFMDKCCLHLFFLMAWVLFINVWKKIMGFIL
jgi:hypothetical protein